MDDTTEYTFSLFNTVYPLPLAAETGKMKERILLVATIAFAKDGYAAVSMRDLAKSMGINQSSIYNHFASKEELWNEVIDHSGRLYTFYFDRLEEKLVSCETFADALEAIFHHPKRLLNVFTCYAFSLLQTEQFRNPRAGKIFEEVFMTYAVEFLKRWLDTFVERGAVERLDTETVAITIVHAMLMGLQTEVHHLMKHTNRSPYDPRGMLQSIQDFILWSATRTPAKEGP